MPQNPKRSIVVDDALLRDFIDGKLDASLESKVAEFIEARPALQAKVAAFSNDGFLDQVKQAAAETRDSAAKPKMTSAPDQTESESQSALDDVPAELAAYEPYHVIKELGRGGMGVVYLAKNIEMDRLEVLKVLNERLLDHSDAQQRFRKEIRSIAKLNHPTIVTSHSILPLTSLLVFAMEYVQGMDLHKFIYQHQPLKISLACSLAQQLATGLQHAHEKGLVHRDIKPSNAIVYKADGQLKLKILDFGLAKASSDKATSSLTQDGTMLGTLEYMSPEQTLNPSKADIRADIYSLGCTVYHMLAGKPPFEGTLGEVMSAHAQQEPIAIDLVRPEVPVELAGVVGRMMAKQASKRYQTPAEVMEALTPFVGKSKAKQRRSMSPAAPDTVNHLASPSVDTSVEEASPSALQSQFSDSVPSESLEGFVTVQTDRRTAAINRAKRNPKLLFRIAAMMGVIAFASVVYVNTDYGTLQIRAEDPNIRVIVDKKEIRLMDGSTDHRLFTGSHSLRVRVNGTDVPLGRNEPIKIDGKSHQLVVRLADKTLAGRTFEVRRGEQLALTISLEQDESVIAPSEHGVEISIFAACDDSFEMYLSGAFLLKGKGRGAAACNAVVRPGDVITVKTIDWGGGHGFACAVLPKDARLKPLVTSNESRWRAYRPADEANWHDLAGIQDEILCNSGNTWAASIVHERTELKNVGLIWGWRDGWSHQRGGVSYLVLRIPRFEKQAEAAGSSASATPERDQRPLPIKAPDVKLAEGDAAGDDERERPQVRTQLIPPHVFGRRVFANGVTGTSTKTIAWDWGDGNRMPHDWFPATHEYRKPGKYAVAVTASGPGAEADSIEISVAIRDMKRQVDLLRHIDIGGATGAGKWTMQRGELISPAVRRSYVPLKVGDAPDRYQISMDVEVIEGRGMCLAMPVGGSHCELVIDGVNDGSGICFIDGKNEVHRDNVTRLEGIVLERGRTYRLDVFVHSQGVYVLRDDQLLLHWLGDPQRLSHPRSGLWLGSWVGRYKVSRMDLIEFSGKSS